MIAEEYDRRRTELPNRTCATVDQNRLVLVLASPVTSWDIESNTSPLHAIGCDLVRPVKSESGCMETERDSGGFIVGESGWELVAVNKNRDMSGCS